MPRHLTNDDKVRLVEKKYNSNAEEQERLDAYNLADKEAYKKAHRGITSQTKSSRERERKVAGLMYTKAGQLKVKPEELHGAIEYLRIRDKQEDLAADKQEKRAGRVAKAQKRYEQKQRRNNK